MSGPCRAAAAAARRLLDPASACGATAWYLALTAAMTWPLAAHAGSRLPNDLGDPAFVCWVLWWNADHLLRFLSGNLSALDGFWNANIFHPDPLALAYSEHMVAQALQVLPLYAASRNLIACYNALFLSTFALSALGMYLLVRELTGNGRAAFLAGLVYGFTPYRLGQLGHLQVLSSQWMPFVLLGLRRFFEARGNRRLPAWAGAPPAAPPPRRRAAGWLPLAGAMAAYIAQDLSCGYYLLYFSPFLAAYALWEIGVRRLWRDGGTLALLATGAAAAAGAVLPFMLPYLDARRLGFEPRPLSELAAFSADALSYARASGLLWLWPDGFTWVAKPEGALFPGFTPLLLAALGLACLAASLRRRVLDWPALGGWRLAAAIPVALVGLWALDLARRVLVAGQHIGRIRRFSPFLAVLPHTLGVVAGAAALLLALSARARRAALLALSSGRAFFTASLLAAAWLSFGPQVRTAHRGISGETVYMWLYRYVPGFDGLRVPSRFGMLVMLFLAILAGYGAARLVRPDTGPGTGSAGWRARAAWRPALLSALCAFFLLESTGAPLPTRALEWARRDRQDARPMRLEDLRPVYSFVAGLPRGTVVLELPIGGIEDETRAVLLSTTHAHRLVNGYSGHFPARYRRLADRLRRAAAGDEDAWLAILESGATCVVVDEWAFEGGAGRDLSTWLARRGARPLASLNQTSVFEITH